MARPASKPERIRRWLRLLPMPARVVGETEDGELVEASEDLVKKQRFAPVARNLSTCVRIKALDAKGGLIRVLPLEEPIDDTDPDAQTDNERGRRRASDAGTLVSIDVPKLVSAISENMVKVAQSTAEQNAKAHAAGFEAMTAVMGVALRLLMRLEGMVDEQPEAPEVSFRDQIGAGLLTQALAGKAPAQQQQQQQQPPNGNGVDPAALAALMQNPALMAQVEQFFGGFGGGQPPPEGAT